MAKKLSSVIKDQTDRALWEVWNIIDCVPEELWSREYCEMPLYKHIYHMLHSLDLWYINPKASDYCEPEIHVPDLNNLDVVQTDLFQNRRFQTTMTLSRIRSQLIQIFSTIQC